MVKSSLFLSDCFWLHCHAPLYLDNLHRVCIRFISDWLSWVFYFWLCTFSTLSLTSYFYWPVTCIHCFFWFWIYIPLSPNCSVFFLYRNLLSSLHYFKTSFNAIFSRRLPTPWRWEGPNQSRLFDPRLVSLGWDGACWSGRLPSLYQLSLI